MTRRAIPAAALTSLLVLAGCDQLDPLKRDYMWHPADINRQNIAAMAVNPNDLIRGRQAGRRRAVNEADAVEKIWSGKPTPLPGSAASGGGAATGTGGTGAGATGPAGGGT